MRKLLLFPLLFLFAHLVIASGIDSNTLLMLHFNGDVADSSAYARTVTNNGAELTTTYKKFGSGAVYSDNTAGGEYVNLTSTADFNFGTNDFTIDFWYNRTSIATNYDSLISFSQNNAYADFFGQRYVDQGTYGVELAFYDVAGGEVWRIFCNNSAGDIYKWAHIAFVRHGSNCTVYYNGRINTTSSRDAGTSGGTWNCSGKTFGSGTLPLKFYQPFHTSQGTMIGVIDEFRISNYSVWTAEFTPPTSEYSASSLPNITSYNVLSAENGGSAWNTNKSYAVQTYDTTPTVDITTDIIANCRISSSEGVGDKNYTGMLDNTRNCTENSATNHTCTLYPTDELITFSEYLYISCQGTSGLESYASTSGALTIELLGIEENSTKALDEGIASSEIGGLATTYTDKQVYLANTTTQATGAVERVVNYGNYRYMFNLYEDTAIGLFNLTPRIYVMEIQLETMSYSEIKNLVSQYINDTYQG
jgi:hypothetical protein